MRRARRSRAAPGLRGRRVGDFEECGIAARAAEAREGKIVEVSIERRFRGSVRLVTLHLWRVAKSTDIEEGFAEAHALGMIDAGNEAFMRRCFDLAQQLEAGETPSEPITLEMVDELQACAIRLNSADPA